MNSYYVINLNSSNNSNITDELIEKINYQAFNMCNCDGVEDYSLNELEVDSILEEEAYCGGNIPDNLIEKINCYKKESLMNFKFYFNKETAYEDSNDFLDYLLVNLNPNLFNITIKKEFNQNWNKEWQSHFSTISVGDSIKIIPVWEKEIVENNLVTHTYINPGMGFGTGNHATTYLCLEILSELSKNDYNFSKVLDFGCGSGILGITAGKIKNNEVDFYDIDLNALENCQENIEHNFENLSTTNYNILKKKEFNKKYNLIFANILLPVLKEEKSTLLNLMEKDCFLILSGILNNQVQELLKYYKVFNNFKLCQITSHGDWSAVLLQKIK
jgi:ribosomal protein L11 methyltransferase